MKPATKRLAGWRYSVFGLRDLLHDPVVEDGHALAHRHGLHLVVRHVDRGDTQPRLQVRELRTRLDPKLGVQVGERLIHEEDLGMTNDGAPHGHALALPAGELLGLAVEVFDQVQDACRLQDLLLAVRLGYLLLPEREAHVLRHGHVRVERVALEDHGHVPVLGLDEGHVTVADPDGALVAGLQSCQHAQGRRLAGPGWADQDEEFSVSDGEVETIDCRSLGARVGASRFLVLDDSHGSPT